MIYDGNIGFLVIKSDEIGWMIFYDYDYEGCLINVMCFMGVVISLYWEMEKFIIIDIENFNCDDDVIVIINLFLVEVFYIVV